MIAYQRETASQVIEEIKPLLERHWEEIAHHKDIPLRPDYEAYARMETAGVLRIYTARYLGELIGYGIFFIFPRHIHYMTSKQASQDILFLLPEYRGVRDGAALIAFCDDQLRDEGVQVVNQHVKHSFDWGALLLHMGYEAVETIYSKRLDKE